MRRTNWLAAALAGLAVAIAVGGTVYNHAFVETAATGTTLAEQVAEVCARGGQAAAELGKACEKADEVKDAPVAQQAVVDPGELRQAARTAVAEFCAAPNRPCRGSDGATPNFDLIVDAVVARIPTPQNGRDAPVPDYAALVAAYCGQAGEPCRGLQGEKGEKGDPPACMAEASQCRGADGQPPSSWTTTYSDGTAETCGRADGFDPAAPRYTCTRSAPSSSNPPLPLGGS